MYMCLFLTYVWKRIHFGVRETFWRASRRLLDASRGQKKVTHGLKKVTHGLYKSDLVPRTGSGTLSIAYWQPLMAVSGGQFVNVLILNSGHWI